MRFIKYIPDSEISIYLESKPIANHLALIIAKRARRTKCTINNLEIGEAFIGDSGKIGITEQQYRTAKTQLAKINFATFRATNKGTIAKLVSTEVWDINTDASNGQSNEQVTDNSTPKQRVTKNVKNKRKKESLGENIFDKRKAKQLPFDVVSTSETIRATYQKPFVDLKLDIKNIFQIDATDTDIETAINTFATVAVAQYPKYKGIHDYTKLCDLFKAWINSSIKYEANKPKEQPQELEAYLLQIYKEREVKNFKENGDFAKWETLLKDNNFKISNIATGYKSPNITTLFIFEIMYLRLGANLGGSSPDKKIESFKKLFDKQNEYNCKFGNFREIVEAYGKTQRH